MLPESIKAIATPLGNLELCANGRQVVAVPSLHPDTKQTYRVEKALDIVRVPNLDEVVARIASFKAQPTPASPRVALIPPNGDIKINPRVIQELESYFLGHGHKVMGDWLHGSCVHKQNHKDGEIATPRLALTALVLTGFATFVEQSWQQISVKR